MLDIASKIVALVVAAVGAITTIFNVFFQGERKRKQKYYESLLKPFAVAYQRDPNINTVAFVQSRVNREDDSIPKYIFFLVDSQKLEEDDLVKKQANNETKELSTDRDRLKKVLIHDYFNFYPNEYNKKRNLFEAVQKILTYLMFLLTFLFIFLGAFLIASGAIMLISCLFAVISKVPADWCGAVKYTLVGLVVSFAGLLPIKISEFQSGDIYSVKKKKINKEINKKVSRFNKHSGEYIL